MYSLWCCSLYILSRRVLPSSPGSGYAAHTRFPLGVGVECVGCPGDSLRRGRAAPAAWRGQRLVRIQAHAPIARRPLLRGGAERGSSVLQLLYVGQNACTSGTIGTPLAETPHVKCPDGKYADAEAGSCAFCPDITQRAVTNGQSACVDCDAGRYQSSPGENGCIDCQSGRFQSATGKSLQIVLQGVLSSARPRAWLVLAATCFFRWNGLLRRHG